MSADPGDIHETIDALIRDRIRVSVVGLAAQVAICNELCARTNGGSDSDGGDGHYSVALHEQHFRELMLAVTTPPATRANDRQNHASLLMMGFPSRVLAGTGTGTGTGTATGAGNGSGTGGGSSSDTIHYCACHHRPTREGYACTRCGARVCRLPSECPGCGLTLILSTHLARSYHHLFPLRNWAEVSWAQARARGRHRSRACHACLAPFPEVPPAADGAAATAAAPAAAQKEKGKITINVKGKDKTKEKAPSASAPAPAPAPLPKIKGLSESGRYACEVCGNHFCIDCDLFAHEVLHNCPGCQGDGAGAGGGGGAGAGEAEAGPAQNGKVNGGGAPQENGRAGAADAGVMEIDS